MLDRLLRRARADAEQDELLARHRERGGRHVAALTRDVSLGDFGAGFVYVQVNPWTTHAGQELLAEPPEVAVSTVVAAVDSGTPEIALALSRRKLAYTADDVALLLQLGRRPPARPWHGVDALRVAIGAAEKLEADAWTDAAREAVAQAVRFVERNSETGYEVERTKLLARLRKLPGGRQPAALDLSVISIGDELGKPLRKAIAERWAGDTNAAALVLHLSQATSGTTPSKKWSSEAQRLAAATPDGDDLVRTILAASLETADGTRRGWGNFVLHQWLADENAVLVRGAAWAAAGIQAEWAAALLAEVAAHAAAPYEPGHDPRSIKVANACLRGLGDLGDDAALAALAQLKARIKHRTIAKQVERGLDDAAASAGITKGQLLERQVPTFDLDADGRKEVELGNATAIVDRDTLAWLSGGKPVKSVPKAVKEEHGAELRALRAESKEIKKALAAERVRVEGLLAEERTWPLEEWRALYLEHPLTGAYGRRLIWTFANGSAFPLDGAFVRADGSEFEPEGDVRIWHPIDERPQSVGTWRRFLVDRQLVQPFKQAFREVYLVAPAELDTRTYSNRFAAHILRYRQAYALIKARGWSVVALGPYDNDGGRQWRDFESHGLRVEFWMEHAAEDWGEQDTIANIAATDQVRFAPLGGGDPLPVADVPRVVFSEAMRDVDLFVGVASIAADPEWVDRGEGHRDYWYAHSFGELSATAETRREVLREIVPQLKIAARLELGDRYLAVRGDLRTYRIHLGSANVLMEPNDEYLCIVPARGKSAGNVHLPFEDDDRLSMILSKAFLLADDRKITDQTILGQIER